MIRIQYIVNGKCILCNGSGFVKDYNNIFNRKKGWVFINSKYKGFVPCDCNQDQNPIVTTN